MARSSPAAIHGIGSVADVAGMIAAGRVLVLAGAEASLAQLPPGRWIGGTAARFLTPEGGRPAAAQILYTDLTGAAAQTELRLFSAADIHEIARYYPDNGFAILIVPGFSNLLRRITAFIIDYDGLYNAPLTGWVSAVDLADVPAAQPKCFGGGPQAYTEQAAVLYVTLPDDLFAQLHVANLFTPRSGPEIRFTSGGQITDGECLINGEPQNFARYLAAAQIDKRLPLIADREGALLNVSVLSADAQTGKMVFLGPICSRLAYRLAEEVLDYEAEFLRAVAELDMAEAALASVCALNCLYAGLDAPRGLNFMAPVTFGQIAYSVLNQTLACLAIGCNEDMLEDFTD